MSVRLKVDGTTGKIAVYDYTAGDDAPFTSPMSNIPRLFFHSDLPAIKIIDVRSTTVSLSALASGSAQVGGTFYLGLTEEKTLFAHGLAGIPYVEGRITAIDGGSVNIPLCGSVPIQQASSFPRWLHLGASATNVVLNTFLNGYANFDYPAISVTVETYVTDLLLT